METVRNLTETVSYIKSKKDNERTLQNQPGAMARYQVDDEYAQPAIQSSPAPINTQQF